LTLTEAITRQAVVLMEMLTLSHGMRMGDALIAATELRHLLSVLTSNVEPIAAMELLQIEGVWSDDS
jgi:predicted nucleic acid-binding protein